MNCFLCRILISNALDKNETPSETVKKHIELCSECLEFYNETALLEEGLRIKAPVEDAYLTQRVMSAISKEGRIVSNPRSIYLRNGWVAAAVIAILIFIGAAIFWDSMDNDSASKEEVELVVNDMTELTTIFINTDDGPMEDSILAYMAAPLTDEVKKLSDDALSLKGMILAILPIKLSSESEEGKNRQEH